eukprot:TRINITY_DN386_c0_g1_i1.p1 TRINITY_DN386_c0_g1~~TRINITY_DN386_c0_g1_i1.p1  ORF type:complete len:445 (+),score=65.67 TRINITY_DN386_c0_g1_i1:184-1518(+)
MTSQRCACVEQERDDKMMKIWNWVQSKRKSLPPSSIKLGNANKRSKNHCDPVTKVTEHKEIKRSPPKRVLLLGAGEVGKATLFKQIRRIYGNGFPTDDRKIWKTILHNNAIESIKQLVQNLGTQILAENVASFMAVLSLTSDSILTHEVAGHLTKLWNDPAIKAVYTRRDEFQIHECIEYVMDRIDVMADPFYIPTIEDILHARLRTTGLVEDSSILIQKEKFSVVNTGGQRNERKKWVHCRDNVSAVIFLVNISGYNQVLYEDEATCRLLEDLQLFRDICNSRWFKDTPFILVFNKIDAFERKIVNFPLSDSLLVDNDQIWQNELHGVREKVQHYREGLDWCQKEAFENALNFISDLFLSLNETDRFVHSFVTSVLDGGNVKELMEELRIITNTSQDSVNKTRDAVTTCAEGMSEQVWPLVLTGEILRMVLSRPMSQRHSKLM